MIKSILLMGMQEPTAVKNMSPFEEFKPGDDKIRFYFSKITLKCGE